MHLSRSRRSLAIIASAVAFGMPLYAQEATPDSGPNAAVEYWRASYTALTHTSHLGGGLAPLGDIDWKKIGDNLDRSRMPETYTRAVPYISESAVEDFIIASRREHCDFSIPIENGPATLLPHLGAIRPLARAVRLDAREKLISGDPDAAAERMAALYRAADHLSRDGIMISSLVAMAMAGSANEEVETLIGSARLSAGGRDEILAAIRALDERDPYRMVAAIRGEQALMLGWVRRTYSGDGGSSRFVAETVPMLSTPETIQQPILDAIAMMRTDEFRAALDKADRYYDELLLAWQSDVALSRLATLEARVKAGEFGPVTVVVGPALRKAFSSAERARNDRDTAAAKLDSYQPPAPPARN